MLTIKGMRRGSDLTDNRMTWMDAVRGTCIFLVLVLHAMVAGEQFAAEAPEWFKAANQFFGPYRMPTLMLLSGMLLGRSLQKPMKQYMIGKFSQIYWPFLLWSFLVLLASGQFTIINILKTPISAPTVLWYLWFLTAYYVIAFGLHLRDIPIWPIMIASLLASLILPDFLRMNRFAFLFSFFLAGHLVVLRGLNMQNKEWLAFICLFLFIIGGYLSASGFDIKYKGQYFWAPLSLFLLILWFSSYYSSPVTLKIVEWIGRNSLVFYVSHFPVQLAVTRTLAYFGVMNFWPIFVSALLASLVVGIALQFGRERSPIIASLFDFYAFQRRLSRASVKR